MHHDSERPRSPIDPALWQAYSTTVFEVDREEHARPEPPIEIRIGERCDSLDTLLREHGARRWAVITAWNPASKPLSRAENDARNAELATRLRARGFTLRSTLRSARGIGAAERCEPEETFLVLGIAAEDARRLGREFDQLAIVVSDP